MGHFFKRLKTIKGNVKSVLAETVNNVIRMFTPAEVRLAA